MAKKDKKKEKVTSIVTYACWPKNPCGTCFACKFAGRKGWGSKR